MFQQISADVNKTGTHSIGNESFITWCLFPT